MRDVLLLNADFAPVGILHWERAVGLLLDQRVRVVESYPNRVIRSPSRSLDWPAVVHLVRYARVRARPSFHRRNVLARDGFTCQYCGVRPGQAELTLDHVVPRAQAVGGRVRTAQGRDVPVHGWENVVACCKTCNFSKGARTPAEAGLTLRSVPRPPGPQDAIRYALRRVDPPEPWQPFLPVASLAS